MTRTQRLTHLALLTAVALILFVIEAQIPAPVPIPGIKLGLANIITLVALYLYGPRSALAVLLTRILLGSFFAAQMMTLFFSLAGGLLCFAVSALLYRRFSVKTCWILSMIGAIFHNIGQILVAMAVTGTPDVLWYLPPLLVSGLITGCFTGFAARFFLAHLEGLTTHAK